MEKIIAKGQFLFGMAMLAFGGENLVCAHLGRGVSGVPWSPANSLLAYLAGTVLLVAGLSITANVRARMTAVLLGILFLLLLLFFEVPAVIAEPASVSIRTVFFETLALGSAALMLAGTLPSDGSRPWDRAMNKLIQWGPRLFGASSIVFGVDHFLVLALIASLVPAWIPGGMFWAYFTGVAFIAAGISIVTRRMDQWAGLLLGVMFLLWFVLLHTPRTVSAIRAHDPNAADEWSSAFIALGICGGSWICAWNARLRSGRQRPGG